uniref:ADP-ribosyl cyclase/cyclic ADP-ribose hydrolase n=1 Tax=Quercus lobata TaxID=97700 RepID=A0A7N2LK38_QUELO
MALIPSAASSSSSTSSKGRKYNVFLSFRGEDTRTKFTDHLYAGLIQKGISTFRDDEKLKQGTLIAPELLKAIEESRFAVVILSRDYASSRWCLIELTKIVECIEKTGLVVLPIFHYVDPSDVRNHKGIFAKAIAKHEESFKDNIEIVQTWKAALTKIANLAGWDLKNKHESIVIQEIIGRIFSELYSKFSSVSEELVGMDSCVEEMLDSYLGRGLGSVCFVGIYGMGGIGKTTLAQEIYKRISGNFEASSFIANVREETKNQGLVSLQKQLLSKILKKSEINIWNVFEGINIIRNTLCNKRVFIVLDDVDKEEQFGALAGKHDWFGSGSRIIVTSRDSHLLIRCGVSDIYTAKGLSNDDALQLFSWRAFHKPYPKGDYVNLSNDFVNYAKGLPLALKVLGSSLFAKRTNEWKSALDKLKKEPNKDILDILEISFDGLTNSQKGLFLDIACFFKGENKDSIRDILESFGYYPDYNIGVLMDKSLITIDNERALWMHDLLQDMGQEIVLRESPKEPGGHSRLWIYEDVIHVLKNNTGTEVVEGIMLNIPIQKKEQLSAEAFSKMKFLRLLKIGNKELLKNFINGPMQLPEDILGGVMQLPQGLSYLSNELCVLEWNGYHLKYIPTNFQPNKLVELRMRCSGIKQLWKGNMNLAELKLIDLSCSRNLIEIPDLSGAPKLKQLILQHCTRLYKIHSSLGDLKQLIRLDLNGCKCLENLPHKVSLEALEIFNLGGCSRLKKFPKIVGNMSCLSKLCLSETAINELTFSAEYLTGLIELDLRNCKNLFSLSDAYCCLISLKILILSGCSILKELPENLGNIEGLEKLDVSGTALTRLPSSIVHLKNLRVLSLRECVGLLSKSSNMLLSFPLMQPRSSPDLMGMLQGLCSLTNLDLSYCNLQTIPNALGCLSSLEYLNLVGNNFVCLPESIIQLSNLESLCLDGCTQLRMCPKLPLNIKFINASGCTSLETLSLRPEHDFEPNLHLQYCDKLIKNEGYSELFSTMLRRYIIKISARSFSYLTIPGSEIPNWFRHRNVGISVNLEVPSHLLLSNKFMGIAVCTVFIPRRYRPLYQLHEEELLSCLIKINKRYLIRRAISLSAEIDKIESSQIYLLYFPSINFEGRWKDVLNQVDAYAFNQIEVEFITSVKADLNLNKVDPYASSQLEIMKCGAHLVLEQDIEDLKQSKVGSSSCIITPYEDNDLDDSEKDSKIKGSPDAKPPHLKWIGSVSGVDSDDDGVELGLVLFLFGYKET